MPPDPAPRKRKRRVSPAKAAEMLAHASWLTKFQGDLETMAKVIHDAEVRRYIRQWEKYENEQPSPDPFQRAMETKGIASVVLTFEVLRDVLPLGKGMLGSIPGAALKMIEAIVRAAYPDTSFAQLVVDDGKRIIPRVVSIIAGAEAAS